MSPQHENFDDEPIMAHNPDENKAALFTSYNTFQEFLMAGNACFTLLSKKSGNHFTFRLRRAKGNIDNKNAPLFVYVLNGKNGIKSYRHIGTVFIENSNEFGTKMQFNPNRNLLEASSLRAFEYAFRFISKLDMPKDCEVWGSGRCGRCNRILTNPDSITIGFGVECIRFTKWYQILENSANNMMSRKTEAQKLAAVHTALLDIAAVRD